MSIGFIFWVIMLLWLLLAVVLNLGHPAVMPYGALGNSLLLFILFFLIGWKVFGWPING